MATSKQRVVVQSAAAGAALMYGVLYALGYAPLWFGPELPSWARPLAADSRAADELGRLARDGRFGLFRPKASTRNFLAVHKSTAERRVERRVYVDRARGVLRGVVHFGPDVEGPPRCVHGGCSAAVVDGCLGALAHVVSLLPCVTANLSVNYRRKIPLGTCAGVRCWLVRQEGRKIHLAFQLFELPDSSDAAWSAAASDQGSDQEPPPAAVFVEGTALFVQVTASILTSSSLLP